MTRLSSGHKDVTPTAFIPRFRPNLKIKGLFRVVPSSVPLVAVDQVFVAACGSCRHGTVISQEVDHEISKNIETG